MFITELFFNHLKYLLVSKLCTINIIILLVLLTACQSNKDQAFQTKSNKITISGEVSYKVESGEIVLVSKDIISESDVNYLLKLDSNNYFSFHGEIDFPQIFTLLINRKPFQFFVFPSDSVFLHISDTLSLSCENKVHELYSNYLISVTKIIFEHELDEYIFEASKRPVADFKVAVEQFRVDLISEIDIFNSKNAINEPILIDLGYREIDLKIGTLLMDYVIFRQYMHKIETQLPDDFFALVDSLKSNINELLVTSVFFSFYNTLSPLYNFWDIDSFRLQIMEEDRSLSRDIVLSHYIGFHINNKDTLKAGKALKLFYDEIDNEIIKLELKTRYQKAKEIVENPVIKNALLSDFSSLSEAGSVLSEIISKHKNKVIYLKFWAPWCSPCMAQIAYADKLVEEFSPDDFALINLCVQTPKDRWKATIAEKGLKGYQYLLNDQQYDQLKVLFQIHGIPHYVLIDKNGNIIDENAPIPGELVFGSSYSESEKDNQQADFDRTDGMNYELFDKITLLILK